MFLKFPNHSFIKADETEWRKKEKKLIKKLAQAELSSDEFEENRKRIN